jgi:hypothetical protein
MPVLEGYGVDVVVILTRYGAPIESNTYEHFRQRSPAFEIDPIPCVAYINIVRTVDGHELRLVILEKQFDNSEEFQRQLLSTLTEIREDIATLKDRSKVPKP